VVLDCVIFFVVVGMGAAVSTSSHVCVVVWVGFFVWVGLQLILGWGE